MSGHGERPEPTQTTPEGADRESLGLPGEGGTAIPVPSREQVLRDFEKVAKAKPRKRRKDGSERSR
jgi:hypothetical protein